MMHEPQQKRTRGWLTRLHALALAMSAAGCGARTEETSDSQSHWLSCTEQSECGDLACECGLCTTECTSDADCWSTLETGAARCQAVETLGCNQASNATRICVPDCSGDRCVMDQTLSSSEDVVTLTAVQPPDLVSVPECAELSSPLSLPAGFLTDLTRYAGPATVEESGSTRLRLIPDAVAGHVVELSSYPTEVGKLFTAGQRFELEVEVDDANYKALIVRDEASKPLLVIYHGYDAWYQTGRFNKANVGGRLELRMTCQSNVGDVCFQSQVQSNYMGIFSADTQATVDGSGYRPVTIDGSPYQVYIWASGVFGGERMPDCADVMQGRTLSFVLYKKVD